MSYIGKPYQEKERKKIIKISKFFLKIILILDWRAKDSNLADTMLRAEKGRWDNIAMLKSKVTLILFKIKSLEAKLFKF